MTTRQRISRWAWAGLLCAGWAWGCGGQKADEAQPKVDAAKAAQPASGEQPAPEGVKPAPGGAPTVSSPAMAAFLKTGFGTSEKVAAALKKHAGPSVEYADMDVFDLKDPKVLVEKDGCYTVEATAGITIRTYTLCWADEKITRVTFEGMR